MSLRNEHRTLPLSPPKSGSKRKMSKIWIIICDNFETVDDVVVVVVEVVYLLIKQMSVSIGSRIQAFDWYRYQWPGMTLNDVIAIILRYFTEFDNLVDRLGYSGSR